MNIKILTLLLLFSIFTFDDIYAQTTKIDSLENILKTHKSEDTVKVNLLNEIALLVYKTDSNKANSYVYQAGELSYAINFKKGIAESLWIEGLSLSFYKSYKKGLECFIEAVKIAEEINFKPGLVKYLNHSGMRYANTGNVTLALECYDKAMKIAEELNDKSNVAWSMLNRCVIFTGQGKYEMALDDYQKALLICDEIKDFNLRPAILNNMGFIHECQGNYSKALDYHHQSLKIREANNDKIGIVYSFGNIGNVLAAQANYEGAFEYHFKGLKIAEDLNDKKLISLSYEYIGNVFLLTNDSKSLEYLEKALVLAEELYYTTAILNVSKKIGEFYRKQGDYKQALKYYQKSMFFAEEMNRKRIICEIWYKIGAIHFSQKEYSKALSYSLKSLAIANEMKLLTFQKDIHNQLSEIYAANNDYAKAYMNHKLYKELSDSIYKDENLKKIIELEYTYKFEKEKQDIELEQQKKDAFQAAEKKHQKTIMLTFLGGFILMSLLAFIIYSLYRMKHKTNIMLTKQQQEIQEKNNELLQLNKEISTQKDEITIINTQIELKNSKLKELNETKDMFFGIIAHDLKNPFNTILGFSDLLMDSCNQFDQEKTMNYVGMMHESAENAYRLLENLLEWSMSQTGKIKYKPGNLLVNDLVVENKKLYENLSKAKNISIHNQIPNNLMVYADYHMLGTILRNLITNALKFTPKGGSISITSDLLNNGIEITVSDTGIGIDEETENKLFKINEKVSTLGTEQETGTGLGLLLCKEFVEKHDGKIWVESKPNKGSQFKFFLPLN